LEGAVIFQKGFKRARSLAQKLREIRLSAGINEEKEKGRT
jgi:hypothetical protein